MKTSRDADVSIVHRHVTGSEQRTQRAHEKLGKSSPCGFASEDESGVLTKLRSEFCQFRVVEVVKDEIANNHLILAIARKRAKVG